MNEWMFLDNGESLDTQQGHRCLNSRWFQENDDVIKIMEEITHELVNKEHEFIASYSGECDIPSICNEVFNRHPHSNTDSNLWKEGTFETDQQNRPSPVSFSEISETNDKYSVNDFPAAPGPSRLPLNGSEGYFCEEEFQPEPFQALPTNTKQFTCTIGQEVSKSNYISKEHKQIYGGEKKNLCPTCGKSFSRKYDLQMHVRTHRGDLPFPCDVCGMRFRTNNYLEWHLETHIREKTYKCDICGKSFKWKSFLKNHEVVHWKGKPFRCDICGKSYKWKCYLKQHEVIHSEEKPFTCDICGKSFKWKRALKNHEVVHSVGKPFRCDICGKSFKWKRALKNHEVVHSEEKSFNYNLCSKGFKRKESLKEHLEIHSRENFLCEFCGQSFDYWHSLKMHESNHTVDRV